MGRSLYLVVLVGVSLGALSACVPIAIDPARDQFGVSTARPDVAAAPPADPQLAELNRKARAICTTGYHGSAPTVQPAQNDQQLVHQQLRCAHYDRVWANIF